MIYTVNKSQVPYVRIYRDNVTRSWNLDVMIYTDEFNQTKAAVPVL